MADFLQPVQIKPKPYSWPNKQTRFCFFVIWVDWPCLSAYTWLHLVHIPLMFTLSVKSTCLQRGFLSANRASSVSETGEVSIPLPRPQIKTQILAEIIQIPRGLQTYPLFLGRCLPQGGQSVSLWSQADANGLSVQQVHPAALSSAAWAEQTPRCGNTALFSDKYHHDRQCWIIRATCVFSWWIMGVQNLHFQIGFNGLEKHHQLFGIAWQQQGVSANREVGHSYSSFLTQI